MKKLLIISFVLCFIQLGYTQVRTKSDVKGATTKTQSNATPGAVGVNINLTSIFHSLKRKCNQVKIVFPKTESNFKSDVTNPPTFKWKSSKSKLVKSYKVGLAILNGKEKTMLYQGDTYKTQFAWPKNVMWKSTKKEKVTYQFFVMALMKKGSKCKNVVESTKFTVITNVNKRGVIQPGGQSPQSGATIKVQGKGAVSTITNGSKDETVRLKMLADELVNLAAKGYPHHQGSNKETVNLKKLADELVNLAANKYPHNQGSNKKTVSLKKLADELVNLAVKEYPHHHGDNKETARLKILADELVNLAAKDKDGVGNLSSNVKENLVKKKPSRTGRNPQTGATIKAQGLSEPDAGNALNTLKNKETQKIILISPKNNAHFKSISEIENFTWKLIGEKIANPTYVIEIIKIGNKKQADIIYHGETTNTRIYAKKVAKFKAGSALSSTANRYANNNGSFGEGHYKWRVTETSTGISPSYSFFSVSNCDINFTTSNERVIMELGVKEKSIKREARAGRNPQTGATIKGISKNDIINNPLGGDSAARGRRKARKACVASGGDFVESATDYICIHKLKTNLRENNPNPDELLRSKKKRCWKAGGNWVTNASGSKCSRPISKDVK